MPHGQRPPFGPKTPYRHIGDLPMKKAFLPNSDQTLLCQIGVDKAIFGNFRGQKLDLPEIDFWPPDPRWPIYQAKGHF